MVILAPSRALRLVQAVGDGDRAGTVVERIIAFAEAELADPESRPGECLMPSVEPDDAGWVPAISGTLGQSLVRLRVRRKRREAPLRSGHARRS
jgi:hypothetical protein